MKVVQTGRHRSIGAAPNAMQWGYSKSVDTFKTDVGGFLKEFESVDATSPSMREWYIGRGLHGGVGVEIRVHRRLLPAAESRTYLLRGGNGLAGCSRSLDCLHV